MEKWLMPEYYRKFACKADKCRNTCCSGWRIPVSRSEYFSLVTLDCSEKLDQKILNCFVEPDDPTEEHFRYINFNWQGYCHLYDQGLCLLHKERGEKVLPAVCRLYPRSLKQISDQKIVSCSSACERTVELLFEDGNMNIVSGEMAEQPLISYELDPEDIAQLLEFQTILQDRNTTLAESLAAICRIINPVEFEKDVKKDDDSLNIALEVLKAIPSSDFAFIDFVNQLLERYENDQDVFRTDRVRFEETYPNWMIFFENVINNSIIYNCFPFVDPRLDKTDAYKGLCTSYGLLRLFSIYQNSCSAEKDDLIDAVALLFRNIEHAPFYYNINIICDNAAVLLNL